VAHKRAGDRHSKTQQQLLRQYEARQAVHAHQQTRRRRDNLIAIGAIVVVAALAGLAQFFYFAAGPGVPTPEPTSSASAEDPTTDIVGDVPDPSLAEGRTWSGTLTLDAAGTALPLGIELDGAAAPQAVSTIVQAASDGTYLGTTCHRLVSGATAQLLQCGSADGTGAADPTFAYGPIENAPADDVYPAGTIAMARLSDDASSNGRQFFIVTADTTLPSDTAGGYSVVGRVTSGLDALVADVVAAGTENGSADGPPAVGVTITGLTIQ